MPRAIIITSVAQLIVPSMCRCQLTYLFDGLELPVNLTVTFQQEISNVDPTCKSLESQCSLSNWRYAQCEDVVWVQLKKKW